MKVAYSFDIFSIEKHGGISTYFQSLIPRIQSTDDVKIFSGFHISSVLSGLHSKGCQIPRLPFSFSLRSSVNFIAQMTELNVFRPDVIHQTYYLPLGIHPGKSKRIITIHDMIHETRPELFSKLDWTASFKKKAAGDADQIIAVSQSTADKIVDILKVPPSRIKIIHHGRPELDLDAVTPFVRSRPYVLYIGKRGGYKNFKALEKVFSANRRLAKDFDLVCFGGEEFSRSELEHFQRAGTQLVPIHGTRDLLYSYIRGARVLVSPSLDEGFGLPVLEAMTLGCPVICSDILPYREVAGSSVEFYESGRAEALHSALDRLIYDDKDLERLRRLGLERSKNFSWKKSTDLHRELYSAASGN